MLKQVDKRAMRPILKQLSEELVALIDVYTVHFGISREEVLAAVLLDIAEGKNDAFPATMMLPLEQNFRKAGWKDGDTKFPPPYVESVDTVLKKAQRNAHLGEVPVRKKSKIVSSAAAMPNDLLRLTIAMMEGKAFLTTVKGDSYLVMPTDLGWQVRGTRYDDPVHTVVKEPLSCSCEDFRFRGRECKHVHCVKELKL